MKQISNQSIQQKHNVIYDRVSKAIQTGRFSSYTAAKKQALYKRLKRRVVLFFTTILFTLLNFNNIKKYFLLVFSFCLPLSIIAQSGQALDFDGIDDKVVTPSPTYTAYTIEAWVKFQGSTANKNIIVYTNGNPTTQFSHQIRTNNNGNFVHYVYGASQVIGTTTASVGTWYHVAITAVNGGNVRLFVNGTEEGQSATIATLWTGGNELQVGTNGGSISGSSAPGFLNGNVDDIRIWNNARSQTEINDNKCISLSGLEANLVAYYPFDNVTTANGTANEIQDESSNSYHGTSSGMDNSDIVTSSSCVVVLPVELIFFNAQLQDQTSLLTWQTVSEENNRGFEIERSANGIGFEKIGFVKGNGTTVEVTNYNLIDESPINGMSYYRLKQMDFDGQFEYSKTVIVEYQIRSTEYRIYPNPVQDELTITNTENVKNIVIYNALGQLLRQFTINNSQLSIHVSDLPKGIYILKVQDINGVITTQQFLK